MPDSSPAATLLTTTHKKLVLLDGNSLLYRGFFAMRALTTSAGQHTNALFSLTMMLLSLLENQKPDVVICAWDSREKKTFRHEEFAAYKGTRPPPPPELTAQAPIARELLTAFRIPQTDAPGYEADDVIGTLAKQGKAAGYDVLIVSGDLDALQLVEPNVRVMTTIKGVTDTVIYDEAAVEKRYGLRPNQLADYRALKGDTSDNIPGVAGVGDKTASQLLQQYETIENLIEHVGEVKQAKLQASLAGGTEQMKQSKRLAIILRDVPLDDRAALPNPDKAAYIPDWPTVRALFERLEFRALLRRVPEPHPQPLSQGERGAEISKTNAEPPVIGGQGGQVDLESPDYDPFADTGEPDVPIAAVVAPAAPPADYREAANDAELADLTEAVKNARSVGVRLHVTDGTLDSRILGVAVAVGEGTVFYVPVESPEVVTTAATESVDPAAPIASLFDPPAQPLAVPAPSERATIPVSLVALLEDPKVAKVTHEAKSDMAVLERYGVALRGIVFDTELAAYLLNAGRRSGYPLHEIASDYAQRELHPLLDKKERKGMEANAIFAHEKNEALAQADAVLATMRVQEPRLSHENLVSVLETLELPVAPILAEMELAGLMVDVPVLQKISSEMGSKIAALELEIYQIAGGEFSIGSPKQLQEILFDRLKIPSGKKTKTGFSTGADVLEELAPDYPIVSLIMRHRELAKLKSTYADAMPLLVRADTRRIHTSLNQTVAATGRLSSSNPNLQNIPIRTAIGREIRRAFVAPEGLVLVSADYSQIELRLFAHVSRDPELVAAFSSGEDIHKYTAGRMYNVPVADVTSDMRRAAKTVNYAVIYGISEFALARRLGIKMTAAKELKTSYFDRFPGVRAYLDETVAFAREKGYVQTLFGRRRHIPDINSRVFQFRQAAERAAANMPIQGSSADIMKLAMIAVYKMLREENFKARLLLQVHDELLFETTPDEVARLAPRVHDCMANAYPLTVALDVEVKTGKTWADVTPVEDMNAPLGMDE